MAPSSQGKEPPQNPGRFIKLFSVVFLLHAGVLLSQAYQLMHLKAPTFSELRRVEGKLILVKKGHDWLTGVEKSDGSRELLSCQLPGDRNQFCFMSNVVDKFGLNAKPDVVMWWYPITVPLEDRVYPYIFQIQLKGANQPFGYTLSNGGRIEFSYKARSDFSYQKTHDVRGSLGIALLYVLAVVFLFVWETNKYSSREK